MILMCNRGRRLESPDDSAFEWYIDACPDDLEEISAPD